jgi:hypothetical protein
MGSVGGGCRLRRDSLAPKPESRTPWKSRLRGGHAYPLDFIYRPHDHVLDSGGDRHIGTDEPVLAA